MRVLLLLFLPLCALAQNFTIAVVPDPQYILNGVERNAMCQWIADNKAALNIAAVLGVGDERNDPTVASQTNMSVACWTIIDSAGLPWLVVPGNHDYTNYASIRRTEISNWDAVFGPGSVFNGTAINSKSWYGGNYASESGSHANWWIKFGAGMQSFIVIGLEVCPRPAVLTWASEVLVANAGRHAIMVTHSYQDSDGSLTAHGDSYGCGTGTAGMDVWHDDHNDFGGYDGPQLWTNFIAAQAPIEIVLSGHNLDAPYASYSTALNISERPVLNVKTDFQNADNSADPDKRVITLLTFRESGVACGTEPNTAPAPCVEVSHYSTAANRYTTAYPPRGFGFQFSYRHRMRSGRIESGRVR